MSASLKSAVTGSAMPAKLSDMKPREQIAYLLDQKKGEIAKMLPSHLNAERLLKVAQIAVTTTPGLLKCDVASLIGAIGQCAQMGLEPNTVLGHAYLVPFKTKRKDSAGNERWVDSVNVIVGYKGFIDLARRSGQIVSIAAHEVCTNDEFELVYGLDERLTHKPALDDRGDIIGFYAVAKLVGGGYAFEFMSLRQVEAIMLASQSQGEIWPLEGSLHRDGPQGVVRRLAKYLPLSIEFQTAAALDGLAEGGKDQHLDAFDGEYSIVGPVMEHIDEETGEITTEAPEAPEPVAPPATPEKSDVPPAKTERRPAQKAPDPTMAVADEWKME